MKRQTNRCPGDLELLGLELRSRLGVPVSPGAGVPLRDVVADVRIHLDLAPVAEGDDPARAFDWDHLLSRLRAVSSGRARRHPEALARDLAAVPLAEDRVHWAEVRLAVPAGDGSAASLRVSYRRGQTRDDPPFAPGRFRRKVVRMRLAGALLKGFARLYHALRPARRWTVPARDPARPGRRAPAPTPIPRILWQTNFTADCSLPLWFNYRRNRRLSRDFEHRYVSTEEREDYLRRHAPSRVLAAYLRLEDGAAQADLWRLFVLWREGGVYMDFDASLVRPLGDILAGREEVRVWNRKRFTNYFLATVPGNPVYAAMLERVVSNVERHGGGETPRIFYATGPGALEPVLDALPPFDMTPHRACCVQGVFSNERFQYVDRPGTKWTHRRTFVRPHTTTGAGTA